MKFALEWHVSRHHARHHMIARNFGGYNAHPLIGKVTTIQKPAFFHTAMLTKVEHRCQAGFKEPHVKTQCPSRSCTLCLDPSQTFLPTSLKSDRFKPAPTCCLMWNIETKQHCMLPGKPEALMH